MKSGADAKRDGSPIADAKPAPAIVSRPRNAHRFRTRGNSDQLVFACAGIRQRDPGDVHPDAPPRYFPPARSAAPVEQSADQPATPDVTSSRPSGQQDRSARDAAETHSAVGAPLAAPAPPPDGLGSGRASLRQ